MTPTILAITEIAGPSADVGPRDGLLLRLRGTTPDGSVVLNLWATDDARAAASADDLHAAVRARSGIEALEQGTRTTVVRHVRVDDVTPATTP